MSPEQHKDLFPSQPSPPPPIHTDPSGQDPQVASAKHPHTIEETPEEEALRKAKENLEKVKQEALAKIEEADRAVTAKKEEERVKKAEARAKRKEEFDKKADAALKEREKQKEARREEIEFELGAILKEHGNMRSSVPLTSNFWDLQNEYHNLLPTATASAVARPPVR